MPMALHLPGRFSRYLARLAGAGQLPSPPRGACSSYSTAAAGTTLGGSGASRPPRGACSSSYSTAAAGTGQLLPRPPPRGAGSSYSTAAADATPAGIVPGTIITRADCVVIGAGIIGLAICRELAVSGRGVLVLEARTEAGMSKTATRLSDVIHAGASYRPGSLKAQLCTAGR